MSIWQVSWDTGDLESPITVFDVEMTDEEAGRVRQRLLETLEAWQGSEVQPGQEPYGFEVFWHSVLPQWLNEDEEDI